MHRLVIGFGIGGLLLAAACSSDKSGTGNTPTTGGAGGSAAGTGATTAGTTAGGTASGGGMAGSGVTAGTASGGGGAGSVGGAGGGTAGAGGAAAGSGGGGGGTGGGTACDTTLGKAIKFNGDIADSVAGDLGDDATFGDKPRTVEFWGKFIGEKSWAGEHTLLEIGKPSQPDNGNNVWGFDMTGYSNGAGTFGPYTHGVSDNNPGANPLPVFQAATAAIGWLHLSWAYDPTKSPANTRLEFTVNGTVLPTEFNQGKYDATGDKLVTNTGFVLLGASQAFGKEGWDGVMDELRIWNVYRTPQQIHDNMTVIVKPDTAGLVAYYQFNEGDAANVGDSTKKASHKLSACTAAAGPCSNVNAMPPTFVDSDIPGPFTCAP